MRRFAWLAVALSCAGIACTSTAPADPIERGRRVYMASCITCHNPDPTRPGGSGPPVAGSSRELVQARILRAGYPEGYTPQRTTRAMVALPHLAAYVDDVAAFLAAAARSPAPPGG